MSRRARHPAGLADTAAWSGAAPALDRPDVPPGPASHSSESPSAVGALGLEVSLRGFLQDQRIEREIRHGSLQPGILSLQFLEAFGLIDLEPTVLIAPAVIRLFGDADRSTRLSNRLSFAQRDLDFPQLGEDLFDGVTETSHTALPGEIKDDWHLLSPFRKTVCFERSWGLNHTARPTRP